MRARRPRSLADRRSFGPGTEACRRATAAATIFRAPIRSGVDVTVTSAATNRTDLRIADFEVTEDDVRRRSRR
jgi:hypothetical protein